MPVIAVAVAIAVDVSAGAAIAAGTITALGAIAAVGATIGAIGAVTGNKALSIAGTVLGVVGAVGSLASASGLLGDAGSAPLFGPATAAGTADEAAAGTIDAMSGGGSLATSDITDSGLNAVDPTTGETITQATGGADAAPTAAAADGTTTQASAATNAADPGAVPAGTEMAPQDAAAVQSSTQAAAAGGTNATAMNVVGETPISPPSGASANPVPALPPGALTANAPGQAGLPTPNVTETPAPGSGAPGSGLSATANPELNTSAAATENTGPSGFASVLSGIQDFTKSNPLVSYGILQAGGSLLSGLTSTLTPAQVSALNAQAAANNAAAGLTQQQTANLAMPKAVASSSPVTGTPQALVPPSTPPGFINQAPKQPLVTGAPA